MTPNTHYHRIFQDKKRADIHHKLILQSGSHTLSLTLSSLLSFTFCSQCNLKAFAINISTIGWMQRKSQSIYYLIMELFAFKLTSDLKIRHLWTSLPFDSKPRDYKYRIDPYAQQEGGKRACPAVSNPPPPHHSLSFISSWCRPQCRKSMRRGRASFHMQPKKNLQPQ